MALNGVDLFYSARIEPMILNLGGRGMIQTTNDLNFHRQFTQSERQTSSCMASVRSLKIIRNGTIRSSQNCFRDLPFANLIRSLSVGDSTSYQSARKFKSLLRLFHSSDRQRHQFRAGKISVSSRNVLMQRAYPPVKCEQCARIFTGQHRKRKLVRHRKRVHSLLSRNTSLSEDCPGPSDIHVSTSKCESRRRGYSKHKQQVWLVTAHWLSLIDSIHLGIRMTAELERKYHQCL